MRIRYIRDWANGNTNGSNSNWNEIGAYDYNNTNIALNKTVTPSKDGSGSVSASVVTDGSDDVAFAFSGLGNVTIDLGGIYDIDRIRIRRYFPNGNSTTQYHETKTEVSIDGQYWITVFDCTVEGKYYETSEGKIIKLRKEIDKLEDDAPLEDVKNKVIEIENSLQATKDYFKNVLIDKDIECNEIDGMLNLINKVKDISIGKKWASGEYDSVYTNKTSQIAMNLDFVPSMIFVVPKDIYLYGYTHHAKNFVVSNLNTSPSNTLFVTGNGDFYGYISDVNQNSFTLSVRGSVGTKPYGFSSFVWYAFE